MSAISVEIGSTADLGRRSLNRREWTRNVIQDKKLVKHEHHDAAEQGTPQISGRTRRIRAFSKVVVSVD